MNFSVILGSIISGSIILGINAFHCKFGDKLQYQAGDPFHFADVGIYSPP